MQKSFAKIAIAALLIAGGISGCDSISIADIIQPVTEKPAPASVSKSPNAYGALEQSAHEQVNQYRASLNLPPLKLDPRISEVAREHSKAMASDRATFSHDGFEQRRFAHAIKAHQTHDLPRLHAQVDAPQNSAASVTRFDIFDLQHKLSTQCAVRSVLRPK